MGLMAAVGVLPRDVLEGHLVMGELGLDGSIAPCPGLPAAMLASEMDLAFICPEACGPEAAWAGAIWRSWRRPRSFSWSIISRAGR